LQIVGPGGEQKKGIVVSTSFLQPTVKKCQSDKDRDDQQQYKDVF